MWVMHSDTSIIVTSISLNESNSDLPPPSLNIMIDDAQQQQDLLLEADTKRKGAYIGHRSETSTHDVYNEFIEFGYRINYNTWRLTLKSFF
jgi:hypothetical protein